MTALKTLCFATIAGFSVNAMAAEFSFDRPGAGIGTGITPVGRLAWEQAIPTANFQKTKENGVTTETTTVNADMVFRTGLAHNLELQLGWQGPAWSIEKSNGQKTHDHGLGDVSIGIKKAIDLNDDKMQMAVLAQAIIATGNKGFSNEDDIYSIGTVVAYDQNESLNTSISMIYEVQNSDWAVTAIPNLTYKLTDKWSGFSELIYRKAESQDVEYALSSGLMYAFNDRAQLDGNIGVNLDSPDKSYFAGLGVSFLF